VSQLKAFVELASKIDEIRAGIRLVAILPLKCIPCCMRDTVGPFPTNLSEEVTALRTNLPWRLPFQGVWSIEDLNMATRLHEGRSHAERGGEATYLVVARIKRFLEAAVPPESDDKSENAEKRHIARLVVWEEPEP